MIRIHQTTRGGRNAPLGHRGDCFSAALASILELPLERVPRFCDLETMDWGPHINQWLRRYGLSYVEIALSEYTEEAIRPHLGWHVVCGMSPRGCRHAVVAFGRELVHDPFPEIEGEPLLEPHDLEDDNLCWTLGILASRTPNLVARYAL